MQNTTVQNYSGSATSYEPGNEMGIYYNAPEPTLGNSVMQRRTVVCRLEWKPSRYHQWFI